MAVLGVTAIAVGTTTTKTTAQSGSTGGTTGGRPSSPASVRRTAPTLLNAAGVAPERTRTATSHGIDLTPPAPVDHSRSGLYWPPPYFAPLGAPVEPAAAALTAAIMAGAAAAAVVPNPFVVPVPALGTVRRVPAVTTPVAATAALPAPTAVRTWPDHPRRAEPVRVLSEAPASAVLTGGTAGDADVDPRLARITTAPAAIGGRTAASAAAGALQDRTAVGAGHAPDASLPTPVPTTGPGTPVGARAPHGQEPSPLFSDLGSASAGLDAQTGFDELLVRQLLGAG